MAAASKPAPRPELPRCGTCHRRDHVPGTWQGHDYKIPEGHELATKVTVQCPPPFTSTLTSTVDDPGVVRALAEGWTETRRWQVCTAAMCVAESAAHKRPMCLARGGTVPQDQPYSWSGYPGQVLQMPAWGTPAWRARMDTVAGREEVYREWLAQGDMGPDALYDIGARYPALDRAWRGPVYWAPADRHPGWSSYLNAAAIRELTQGEGDELPRWKREQEGEDHE